jgi:hypothetical protein
MSPKMTYVSCVRVPTVRLEVLLTMAMICPQCQGAFSQRLQCPTCGVRLEYHAIPRAAAAAGPERSRAWQQTPWARILIGLLLAQGLYYGLVHLCKAGLLVVDDQAARGVWVTLAGLLVLQGLQALGLLVGGALAGAGQRHALLYGGIVGVWNGVIFIVLQFHNAELFNPVALYGQPVLQTAFGAIGGLAGSLIWRPLPLLGMAPARDAGPIVRQGKSRGFFAGPIAWARVLAGAALAVAGATWATVILDLVVAAGEGHLSIDSHVQAHLVTWEITALAMFVGSALAGATTTNGLKQGGCVGVATAAMLVAFRLGSKHLLLDDLALNAASALVICLVGGWFGSQLFPPISPYAQRKRFGGAAV